METYFPTSRTEANQQIIDDYLEAHPDVIEWQMIDVAHWARSTGRWQPQSLNLTRMCAAELARAARADCFLDNGKRIRAKYPRRESKLVDGKFVQMYFWEECGRATPEHMRASLQQRRQGLVATCAQLKRDTDYFNAHNENGAEIQLEFDFTEDLAELESSAEYPADPNTAPESSE